MRRFLTTSFLALALVVGAAGVAYAQNDLVQEPPGSEQITTPQNDAGLIDVPPGTSIDSAAASTVVDNKTTTDEAYNGIMSRIMSLFAWLVGIAAITLDNAVYYTVVTMGAYVNNLSAIGVTWSILRDIGNIMLIFGFLAVGITTILNVNWYGGGKKMLPMMFVAAVFLNFSLFITEAVIDTGNLFATQFYTQINGGNAAGAKSFDLDSVSREGISSKIMGQLGLQTIYGNAITNKEIFKGGNIWFIGFMGIILFIITAFVMFSLAFVLIARFVILIFLIILAPVGFAGLAIPQLAKTAGKWWDKLFEQTITAPVLLLMLYIALTIITDVRFLTGFGANPNGPEWLGFITGGNLNGFASMMLSFLVAMGLLLAVVIISKNLSAFGAAGASKFAGRLTFGATAWGMRTSGGWIAQKTSRGLRKIGVGSVPLVGTGLVRGFDRLATSSFDVRGIATAGGLKGIGIEAGEAQKGGYKADLKARTESRTKYADELIGFELSQEKKAEQSALQNAIKKLQKAKGNATTVAEVQRIDSQIKTAEENLAKIESWTDKGQQRRYAKALNLWTDEKNLFNKYINFAANTDAAKIIREKAKKSKSDKDWSTNMKKLLEEAEESGGATGAGTKPTTAPAAAPAMGIPPSAPSAPGPAAGH